jgi:hypothetical protein
MLVQLGSYSRRFPTVDVDPSSYDSDMTPFSENTGVLFVEAPQVSRALYPSGTRDVSRSERSQAGQVRGAKLNFIS